MGDTAYLENFRALVRTSQREKHEVAFLYGLRLRGLPQPQQQYRFHPTRKWRLDFAWPQQRIAVEVEGGIWRRSSKGGGYAGAHSHPLSIERDIEKGNALTVLGWRLLRATEKTIKSGEIFDQFSLVLSGRIP